MASLRMNRIFGGHFFRQIYLVLVLIVVLHVDYTIAQNCGNLIQPIDGNADLQEVLQSERNENEDITYTCNPGFTDGGLVGDSGTYNLTCETGSWLTAAGASYHSCDDVDECLTVDCGTDAYCVNVPGTYICICDGSAAFNSGDGTCTAGLLCGAPPVDPCAKRAEADRDPGDMAAYTCKDGYGINGDANDNTYSITCNGGTGQWSSINDYCEDVNECTGANSCDSNAECVNVPGFYFCRCNGGYTGNGFSCSRVTCPALPSDIPNGKLDGSSNTYHQYGDQVTYICNTGYEVNSVEGLDDNLSLLYGITRSSFTVVCTSSGAWSTWPLPYCVLDAFKPCDIVKSLGLCVNGDCVLEKGHAVCRCKTGYTGIACDVKIFGISLILSIIALVLSVVVVIIVSASR